MYLKNRFIALTALVIIEGVLFGKTERETVRSILNVYQKGECEIGPSIYILMFIRTIFHPPLPTLNEQNEIRLET